MGSARRITGMDAIALSSDESDHYAWSVWLGSVWRVLVPGVEKNRLPDALTNLLRARCW